MRQRGSLRHAEMRQETYTVGGLFVYLTLVAATIAVLAVPILVLSFALGMAVALVLGTVVRSRGTARDIAGCESTSTGS